ncbi:hypothetical protein QOT17_001975 [Balamuthia mandrillaris]
MFDAENTALCIRACWSGGVAVGGACSCGGKSAGGGEASSGSRPGFGLLQGYTEQQEAQEQEQALKKSDIKGEEGLLGGDLGAGALSEREHTVEHPQQQQQQQGWGPKDNLLPRVSALATRGDALCTPTALGVAAATSGSCKDHHYQQEEEGKERSLVPEPNGPFIHLPAKSTRPLAIPSWSRRFIVEEPCCSSSASSSLDSSPPSFCSSSPPSFTLLPTPTYSEDHHDGPAQATAAAAADEAGQGGKQVVVVSLDVADSLSATVSQPSATTGLPPQRVGTTTTTTVAAAAAANPRGGPSGVCSEDSECPSGFEFLELAQLLLEEPMFRLGGVVGVVAGGEGGEDAASAPAASSFVFSPPGVGGHGATEQPDPQPVVPVAAAVDPHLSQQPPPQEGEPHTDHGGISKAQRLEPDPSNNFGHHNSRVEKSLNPTHPQGGGSGSDGKGVPLLRVPPMNAPHHPAPSHPSVQPSTVPSHHNYSQNQVQHFNPFLHGSYATGFTGPTAPSPTIGSGSFGPYSHSSPSFAACPMGATSVSSASAYSNSHATMIASHPPSLHALTDSNVLRLSINVPTIGMFYMFSHPETKVGQLLATIEGQVLELYRADIKAEKLQDQFKIDLPPSYTVGSMLKPDSVLTLDFSFRRSNSLPTRPNHRPPHGSYTLMLSASPPSSPPSAASAAAPFHSSSSVDHNNDIHPSSEARHNTNETEDILSVLQRSSAADISFAFTEQPPPHVYQNNEFSCTVCINSSLQLSSSESSLSRSSSSADKKSKDEDANESKVAEKQPSSPFSFSIPPLSSSSSTMIPTSFLPIDLQLWEHKDSGNVQLSEEDFSKRSLLMDRRKGFVIFFLKIRKNSYYGRTPFYLHMRGKDQWKDVPTVISEPIIVSAKKKRRRAGKKRNMLDQHRGKKASDTQSDEEEEEAEEEEEHPSSSHHSHQHQYPSPYYPFPSSSSLSPSELSKHVLPHMYPPLPPSHSHSPSAAAYGAPVPYLGAPYYHPSPYYPPTPYTPYPLPPSPSNRLASSPYPAIPYTASPAPSHPHQPQSSHHHNHASSSHHNYPYYQPPYGPVASSASTNNSGSLASAALHQHHNHLNHHRNNSDADPTNKLHSNDGSSNSGGNSGGPSTSNNGRHSLPFAPQFQQPQQQQGYPPPHKAA